MLLEVGMSLELAEKLHILQTLKFYQGNKETAARVLGCSTRTLYVKLEQYAKEEKEFEVRENERREKQREFDVRQRYGGQQINPIVRSPAEHVASVGKSEDSSNTGVRVESASPAPAKLDLPMQERKEVQVVLPKHSSQGGSSKRR